MFRPATNFCIWFGLMTEKHVPNAIKSGATNRSLLAAMVVTHIKEVVLLQENTASAGSVAKTVLGEDHDQRNKVVRAINANIAYYRKRFITGENQGAPHPDFVHVGKAGVYGQEAWNTLYNECRALGRAGFFLRAWVAERIRSAPDHSTVAVGDLIKAFEKIMPGRLMLVLQKLVAPDMNVGDRHATNLANQLLEAGKDDLEGFAQWLCAEPVQQCPTRLLSDLDAWVDENNKTGVILGKKQDITSKPKPESESPTAVAKSRRSRKKLLKWSLVASSLCIMCFVAAPLAMDNTRAMIKSQGLRATYQYVLHALSDSNLAGKDLRDSAYVLFHNGEVERATAILEQVAYSDIYSEKLRADCFLQLGRIAMDRDLTEAVGYAQTAYDLYAKPANRNWAALDLALIHMLNGNVAQMENWLDDAVALREEGGYGNLPREQRLKIRLAAWQGNRSLSLQMAKEAYQSYQGSDKLLRGMFARELSLAYALHGNTGAARNYAGEAMHLYGSLEYTEGLDLVLINYLLIHRLEGKPFTEYQQQTAQELATEPENIEFRADLHFMEHMTAPN